MIISQLDLTITLIDMQVITVCLCKYNKKEIDQVGDSQTIKWVLWVLIF